MFSISYTRNPTPKSIQKDGSKTLRELTNAERSRKSQTPARTPVHDAARTPARQWAKADSLKTPGQRKSASRSSRIRQRATGSSSNAQPKIAVLEGQQQEPIVVSTQDVGEQEALLETEAVAELEPEAEPDTPVPNSLAPCNKSVQRPQVISSSTLKRSKNRPQSAKKTKDGHADVRGARVIAYKLQKSKAGRGAPFLSGVDIVTRVATEQLATASLIQLSAFNRKVVEAYGEEVEARFLAMCDAVDAHGIIFRTVRKTDRKVAELRDRLLALRKERQLAQDQITSIRGNYIKRKKELISEAAAKQALDVLSDVRSRAAQANASNRGGSKVGAEHVRENTTAELSRVAPLVCGQYGVLGRLREFNDMLEHIS